MGQFTVFLADDSAIIRAGVSAMLARDDDVRVVGVAEDYDSLVAGAEIDVLATRERLCANLGRRRRRPFSGVHPHRAEIVPEAPFIESAQPGRQRLPLGACVLYLLR